MKPGTWFTVCLAAVGTAYVYGCSEEAPKNGGSVPTAEEVVLHVGGITIRHAEVQELVAIMTAMDPTVGERTKTRAAVDQVLALKLHHRDFADKLKQLRETAEGFAKGLGKSASIDQLEEIGKRIRNARLVKHLARPSLPLRVQEWAFEDLNVGRVSPVFETKRGFVVVATKDKRQGVTKVYEQIDLYSVPFYVHEREADHSAWLAKARGTVADQLRSVHPSYRRSLPSWLQP